MIKIYGFIDRDNAVEKISSRTYSQEEIEQMINLIERMNYLGHEVKIFPEEMIDLYSIGNSVNETLIKEMLYTNKIRYQDSGNIMDIVDKINDNTIENDHGLIVMGEFNYDQNYLCCKKSIYKMSQRILEYIPQPDFYDMLPLCYDNCLFSTDVRNSISRVSRAKFNSDIGDYIYHLACLNDYAIDIWESEQCVDNGIFCVRFKSMTGVENSTENDRPTAERRNFIFSWYEIDQESNKIKLDDVVQCEKHTKIERYGRQAQRIHFEIKNTYEGTRVFIGYIGNHLS